MDDDSSSVFSATMELPRPDTPMPDSPRLNSSYSSNGSSPQFGPLTVFEIDMQNLEYVGTYDPNLMCAICHNPMLNPYQLQCDHYFCEQCIRRTFVHQPQNGKNCPSCRAAVRSQDVKPAPRLVEKLLDALEVKCPLHDIGCMRTMARIDVHEHVHRYCGYRSVDCPGYLCLETIQRKDIGLCCQHRQVCCFDCHESVMLLHLREHQLSLCKQRKTNCVDCGDTMLRCELQEHKEVCPDAIAYCSAYPFGCDMGLTRRLLPIHVRVCPLGRLVPFFEAQNARIEEHRNAIKKLKQKNDIYQDALQNIQSYLGLDATRDLDENPSPSDARAPFSSAADQLLSLHESLREELNRVSRGVSELDAKTDTMFLNQNLRTKEEMAHLSAAVSGLRVQTQWLVSHKLQGQRGSSAQAQSLVEAGSSRMGGREGGAGGGLEPVRRMSDSPRQDPKL